MKIAKDRLKQIIKEELEMGEVGHDEFGGGAYPKDPEGYEGRMTKQNLWKIAEYAQKMHDLIHDDENLEPWIEEKIAVASYIMDSVGHYLQYEKHVSHEEGEGEEDHVDFPDEMSDEEEGDELELDAGEFDDEELDYDGEDEYDEEEDEEMTYEGHVAKGDPSTYITDDGKSTKRGLWANVHLKKQRQERSKGK